MGPIGWPETVFIFFLSLILFGPNKLPELARTVGKALAGFQRAKGELKAAVDRETKQLSMDTEMLTCLANQYRAETSTIDEPELQAVLPEGPATQGSGTVPYAAVHVS